MLGTCGIKGRGAPRTGDTTEVLEVAETMTGAESIEDVGCKLLSLCVTEGIEMTGFSGVSNADVVVVVVNVKGTVTVIDSEIVLSEKFDGVATISVKLLANAEVVVTTVGTGKAAAACDTAGTGFAADERFIPNSRLFGVPDEGDPLARRASRSAMLCRCCLRSESIMLSILASFLVRGVRPVPPVDQKKGKKVLY